MRILVCDDDKAMAIKISTWIKEFFGMKKMDMPEICTYMSGEAALEDGADYDIAFLDVEMEGLSGIHTGSEIMKANPDAMIFIITAYPDYIDEAMRYRAFRFFEKPIEKNRLFRNLKDAINIYTRLETKVLIDNKDEQILIKSSSIIFLETKSRKTYIHTQMGDYISDVKLDVWEEKLNMGCFFRGHKSFLVNMAHVFKYNTSLIEMDDGSTAYLSRRKYAEFKKAVLLYMEGMIL